MRRLPLIIVLQFTFIFLYKKSVFAVPPPDFIFEVASQFGLFFSIAIAFFSTFFAAISSFISRYLFKGKSIPKLFYIISIIFLITVSAATAYVYDQIQMNKKQKELSADSTESQGDELITAENCKPLTENYFNLLQNKNYSDAYELSNKTKTLDQFTEAFKDMIYLEVLQVEQTDKNHCSATIIKTYEKYTEKSDVYMVWQNFGNSMVISEIIIENVETTAITTKVSSFATNQEFQAVLAKGTNVFVLDARENEEYEIGNMPGSTHIRSADIFAGDWAKTPLDKPIYVFCWSGVRGKQVSDFLAAKGRDSKYLENGAKGWYDFGGTWTGGILLADKYPEEHYRYLFNLEDLKKEENNGVLIIDARETERYESWHIPGSYSIDLQSTPSDQLDDIYNEIPKNKSIITICDLYVNCFYAKIVGIQMEKLGYTFLGRYNKPWEYRNSL